MRRKHLYQALRLAYRVAKKIYFHIMPRLAIFLAGRPNPRLILFDSPDYNDNGKALSDYIGAHMPGYKIVWIADRPRKIKGIKFVRRTYALGKRLKYAYSLQAMYYARKAKYVFYTHDFAWAPPKHPAQIIVNLWHGTGFKAARTIGAENIFDYMLVPGEVFIASKAKYYQCPPEKIIPIGYPRYDLFKSPPPQKLFTGKVIIWLPTFVNDMDLLQYHNPLPYIFSGMPLIENLNMLQDLDRTCREHDITLIIKKHRFRYSDVPMSKYAHSLTHIKILSDTEFKAHGLELYQLLPHTHGLITDFSSVSVDYLLLNKPIAYTLADMEDYKNTRGFVFDDPKKYMPGAHVYNLEDLKDFIKNIHNHCHQQARQSLMPVMHNPTENYSKRVAEFIIGKD